ncbi:uncharacterized protein LOC126154001 isoform X1 [Schistocerca cancellata]|uniref:uncharacterized protein LOC126154001 isoform X1 n=1 Tax=Schistocerca cancellata TaxID=274614 RepID=UPI0021179C7D|nr:uncharacterized protein LOC126154001 isoform X1 [Schistocerca cancellata]
MRMRKVEQRKWHLVDAPTAYTSWPQQTAVVFGCLSLIVSSGESYRIHRGRSMEEAFDVLGHLVPEISIKILRMLDMKSLGSASKVCKHWRSLCYRDTTLKRRMKRFRELQLLKKKLRRVRKKLAYIKNEIAELGNNHSLKLVFMES